MSVPRDRLVTYLDQYLEVAEWEEKSLNGLQVEGAPEVIRVGLATDAALATFVMAAEAGAAFLIVHHGLFWGSDQAIVGPMRDRIAALLDAGISLYAAHLPLDAHSGVGNNAVLARLLKLENLTPFGRWGQRTIGWRGGLAAPAAVGVDDPADVGRRERVTRAGYALGVLDPGEDAEHAGLHRAEFFRVDEERFALAPARPVGCALADVLAALVAGEEPETDGNAGGEEELGGQRDDAIDEVGLDDFAAYVPLAAGVARQTAVSHHEPGHAAAPSIRVG